MPATSTSTLYCSNLTQQHQHSTKNHVQVNNREPSGSSLTYLLIAHVIPQCSINLVVAEMWYHCNGPSMPSTQSTFQTYMHYIITMHQRLQIYNYVTTMFLCLNIEKTCCLHVLIICILLLPVACPWHWRTKLPRPTREIIEITLLLQMHISIKLIAPPSLPMPENLLGELTLWLWRYQPCNQCNSSGLEMWVHLHNTPYITTQWII